MIRKDGTGVLVWFLFWNIPSLAFAAKCEDSLRFSEIIGTKIVSCAEIVADETLSWKCLTLGLKGQPCCKTCNESYKKRTFSSPGSLSCSNEETFTLNHNEETVNCHTIGHFYPYTYYCFNHADTCCENCDNIDLTCYDIPWNIEIHGSNYSCSRIVDHFPSLCRNKFFASECCHSCKDADPHSCGDNPLRTWKLNNGTRSTCEEYIVEDPDRCLDEDTVENCCWTCDKVTGCVNHMGGTLTLPTGTVVDKCRHLAKQEPFYCKPQYYGGPHNMCCRSCSGIDTQCMNGPLLNLTAPDATKIKTCEEMADKYPYYCTLAEYNDVHVGLCCNSCSTVDQHCVDDPRISWTNTDNQTLRCEDFVKHNPNACETDVNVQMKCCLSCRRNAHCTDTPNAKVKVKLPGKQQQELSCEQMARDHPVLCNDVGGFSPSGKCCRSCLNLYAQDNLCTDHNTDKAINLPSGDSVKSCRELAELYPFYCTKGHGFGEHGQKCCASCKTVESSCPDNPEIAWDHGTYSLSCEDHVKQHPEACQDAMIAENCCRSCRSLEHCKDVPLTTADHLNDILNCRDVVNKYSGLCLNTKYGGFPAGKCCKSCLVVDGSCVDQPDFEVLTDKGNIIRCADAHQFPEICLKNVEDAFIKCCHTCTIIFGEQVESSSQRTFIAPAGYGLFLLSYVLVFLFFW